MAFSLRAPRLLRKEAAVIRVRSINIGDGTDLLKSVDMHRLARDSAIIIGQEFGDRRELVRRFLAANPSWAVLWDERTNSGRKTPIFYDTHRVRLTWWEQIVSVLGGTWLGRVGAGPDRAETKRLNRARFRAANGRRFKILNEHKIAAAFNPAVPLKERERRQKVWWEQAKDFFTEAASTYVVCIGGGDENANPDNPMLRRAVVEMCPDWVWDNDPALPTMVKNRVIDLLGHRKTDRVRVVGRGVTETTGSRMDNLNHRSPYVDYELAGRDTF